MLTDTIINRLSSGGLNWRGPWVDGTSYVVNDLVENDGSSYIATQDHISSPATEPGDGTAWTTVWDLVAAKGEDGADGADGVDGEDGESFIWRGPWSDSSAYIVNDVVYNNGSSYIATSNHHATSSTEPGDGTSWTVVWDIMALKGEKGDQGDPGQDGADGVDGEDGESFIWRGDWSDSSSYIINDVVSNNGSSYIATSNHYASYSTEPGDGTAWITVWDLMAEKGDPGEQGEKGDTGDPGPQGPPGEDGQDGVYDRCDELIMEMEMEFKTSYLCYYKTFGYTNKLLSDIDIYTDSSATVLLFHKDFYYNVSKDLIRTELTRISDNALLISDFSYDNQKNLISIERSGYCYCDDSTSVSSISSSSSSSSSKSSSSSSSSISSSSSSESSSSSSTSSSSESTGVDSTCFVPLSDDFTGTNGEVPNVHRWTQPTGGFTIQDNRAESSLSGGSFEFYNLQSRSEISGDFNIEVDWVELSGPDTDNWYMMFRVAVDSDNYFQIGRGYITANGNHYRSNEKQGGVTGTSTRVGTSATSGTFKIIRSGSTITSYYDDNQLLQESWVTGDVKVQLILQNGGSYPALTGAYDNYVLNSADGVVCAESSSSSSSSSRSSSSSSSSRSSSSSSSSTSTAIYSDDFTGTNGDAPDSSFWDEVDSPNNMSIQNNKLNYSGTEVSTQVTHVTTKTEILVGDFDTQVDFDYSVLDQPGSGNQELMFELMTTGEVIYIAIAIYKNNGGVIQYNAVDSDGSNDLVTTTDTSGKFRITRTGSVIKGYVWSGSQWEWDGNTSGFTFTATDLDSLFVRLRFKQQANTELDGNFDNFSATVG